MTLVKNLLIKKLSDNYGVNEMFGFRKKECTHPKISPDKDAGYCPDCGKYIENRWYLTRCDCCNVKRKSIIKFDTIIPESKYCPNCGSEHYHVEEIRTINFIDINFAVLVKQVNEQRSMNRTQTWLERENTEPIKLLGFNLNLG